MKQNTGKKEYQALLYRTETYAEQVRVLFANAVNDILSFSSSVPSLEDGEVFSYSDNKKLAKKVSDRLRMLHSAVYAAIKNDIALEWDEANKMCDKLAMSVFGKEVFSDTRFAGWFSRNTDAMEAFIKRTENGLNLSDRVWNTTKQLRSEMELAMTVSIGQGESASAISRRVRQYLNNPDKLFRRIRDEEGNLKLSKAAKAYHPGQGVYRSSAKNAMRLARSETNIAYRTSDFERWSQMDFVLGIEINLSRSHPEYDICDILAGRYPKGFMFKGWHPQCFCFANPILADIDELDKIEEAMKAGKPYQSLNEITDMPKNFKEWAVENKERIEKAQKRGTLPYFIKDNKNTVERIINPPTALQRAKERHAARTPEQAEAIRKQWNERKATRKYGESILSYMGGISDVDTSALQNALKGGNTSLVLNEARKLKAIGKDILGLTYLDNPMQVARQFSLSDAKAVNEAVQKKLDSWAGLPLEKQAKKLKFEAYDYLGGNMNGVQQKYPTWAVSQKAYIKQLGIVEDKIYWQNTVNEFLDASSFQTKSQPYLDLVLKLQTAIHKKDKTVAQQTMLDIKKKREQLDKAAAQRAKKKNKKSAPKASVFDDDAYSQERKNNAFWTADEDEADKYYSTYAEGDWKKWSKEDKHIAYLYTSGSRYINEPLFDKYYGQKVSPIDNSIRDSWTDINTLTSLINDATPLQRDVWMQHGEDIGAFYGKFKVRLDELSTKELKALVGKEGVNTPFTSCGVREGGGFASEQVIMKIYAPKGTRGIYAEPYSHYGDGYYGIDGLKWDGTSRQKAGYSPGGEIEFILQRGTKFRILNVRKSGSRYYVDVEIIEQPAKFDNQI
jgi:hypothetical protein